MSIKLKMIAGFCILALLLMLSGLISIYELRKLGQSVTTVLNDNFRSISYADQMSRSLNAQKRIFLQAINDGQVPALAPYDSAATQFEHNLDLAAANLTLSDENAYIDSIGQEFARLTGLCDSLITNRSFITLRQYLQVLTPQFDRVSRHIEHLVQLNQQNLVQTSAELHRSPLRTILPGLLIIVSSIAFTIIFNYMLNYYLIRPIRHMAKGIDDHLRYNRPFDIPLDTQDEVYDLREAIKRLVNRKNRL